MNPSQPQINPFYSAKCTPGALEKMQELREAFKNLSDILESIKSTEDGYVPRFTVGGREMSLAKTNLEQSSMWAIKAISHYNVEESK